ncbi:hypothetical protein Pyrde_1240 [Pyrodictium delaneyi]|uniref:Uncharacterized protein n=1 Tax=Pyrodictium delaneyi TaxID=1273541 RepID=A0A0P0N2Z9_9CREN|nr:PaREP1 family protein [Pyrodictium delaneyi]ALL01288.1 hypothetical protein Pyrde_1240 [Pyrodictium delaneyi]
MPRGPGLVCPYRLAPGARGEGPPREAEKLGLGLEEYIVELLVQGLDPEDRAEEYVEAAIALLERAREELARGDVRRAAEKAWGAAALAVKAYAWWRESRRLASHGELWEYARRMKRELGGWVYDAWMSANGMHTRLYEGWCAREDVEEALQRVERLVREVGARRRQGR